MTVQQQEYMRAYLEQHHGRFTLEGTCDVCWVDSKPGNYGLLEYLIRNDDGTYSCLEPILCITHAQELGVLW